MSAAAISLVILCAVIAVFVWNRLPVGVVAIGAALALYFTRLLDADRVLAGLDRISFGVVVGQDRSLYRRG